LLAHRGGYDLAPDAHHRSTFHMATGHFLTNPGKKTAQDFRFAAGPQNRPAIGTLQGTNLGHEAGTAKEQINQFVIQPVDLAPKFR
jgi:hypothetical protein